MLTDNTIKYNVTQKGSKHVSLYKQVNVKFLLRTLFQFKQDVYLKSRYSGVLYKA